MKRLFDVLLVLLFLPFILLLTAFAALLVRFDSPGPVFFKQRRAGKNGKIFEIYKFRTMVDNAESLGPKVTAHNDPRVTQVGILLRSLKLDEIPQFLNVLKGDMSLVGPRPELPSIVEKFPKEFGEILKVMPGIIGPSQIKNVDEVALMKAAEKDPEGFYLENILPAKLLTDTAYVRNADPFKDVRLLFEGAWTVMWNSIKLRYILESKRRLLFLFLDMILSLISFWAALYLRFEGKVPVYETHMFFYFIPLILAVRAPCFVYFSLYQTLWQYLGIQELFAIVKASLAGSILCTLLFFLLQMDFPPRSVLIIDALLLTSILGGLRIFFKVSAEKLRKPYLGSLGVRKNVLIVGAEDTGEFLVREFIKNPTLGYKPIGFIDDDPEKTGIRIHGVKVLGKIHQLTDVIRVKKADEVIIALPKATALEMREITRKCRDLNLECRVVPTVSSLLSPQTLPLRLRPVDVSDLLGRELVQADLQGIQEFVRGKKVLVTGGGGSIGSELCKIILQNHPEELILVDNAESSLYDIEMEITAKSTGSQIVSYLRNVSNYGEMKKIFERHKPDVVYHAAAYKHVPLMEIHYAEAIKNNILGTKTVADLSLACGADRFVLISTDKAIRPTSIMGATKRVCELYIQSLKSDKTRFLAVRFGNVFNSKGSVVPLFRRQIEQGGPVTVTDPEVTRYFMDVSEAVFLILQATILGTHSEIFVLDMGRAVKIAELARDLIRLMGIPADRMPIKFTGLRPGEKLVEELELGGETSIPTTHQKIRIWKPYKNPAIDIPSSISDLIELVDGGCSRDALIQALKKIVPEYTPWNPQI